MKKLILLLFLIPNIALAAPNFPQQDGYITDAANIISETKEQELEAQLTQLDTTKGIQIALVTVTNLEDNPIRDYALELGRAWGVGIKDVDSGIVFLASIEDREMTIEVGYGLEGALTDIETNYIIQDLIPYFQKQDYDNGFSFGINQIQTALAEENFASATRSTNQTTDTIFTIGFLIIFFFTWISSILARSKSYYAGGIIGLIAGSSLALFLGLGFFAIIAGIISAVVGLLFDMMVSKNYQSQKSTSWWAGGNNHNWWDGPGGGSSGGFGGFGGGSFGGGGSSGRW